MSSPFFSLAGKVAFVTGTSSGLGQHFARALAQAGADIAMSSRDVAKLDAFRKEIEALGAEATKVAPSSAYEWFLVGDEQYKERQFEAAAKSFQQALMLEPNDFFSHMFLGLSQLARDQFAAAQASFLAARAIRPDFQYINLFLGVCAGKLGEKEEAEKLFDDSRYSEDARVALLVNRGVIHYDSGDNAKAIADFEAALKLDKSPKTLVNLATVLAIGVKEPAKAEPLLREAMKLDANDGKAPRLLAKILADRAETDMKQAAMLRAEAVELLWRDGVVGLVFAQHLHHLVLSSSSCRRRETSQDHT